MTGRRRHVAARLAMAVLIASSAIIGAANLSSAAPSREEVQRAEGRLDQLNQELSLLVERYNQAQIRLQDVQGRLADVRTQAEKAAAAADRAIASLNASAARAYTGVGSQIATLFEATSIADFSDRLEFIGSMAQADTDLALGAELARQEARWTAEELVATVEERQGLLEQIGRDRDVIESRIDEARDLYDTLNREFQEALAAQQAAQEAAEEASQTGGSSTGGVVSQGPTPAPPPVSGSAGVAISAAYSVIGTPYVFGAADPSVGFDCSGLTMWAWAQAGVSLPHSSAAQYASLPHVAQSDVQPGDLLFFYSPISHVGMYVGGGQMIHASHPGVPVQVVSVYWDSFVGAARPG
ncbi:MAG TPA: NlpC/P60 family protein [Gemmatimonadota bacterium]|nr:NlpC/P60 family protein [Gemmatimonadota bacterium]